MKWGRDDGTMRGKGGGASVVDQSSSESSKGDLSSVSPAENFGLLWNLFSSPRTENKHRESGDWTTNPIRIKREWSSLWFFWEKESRCNYIWGVKKGGGLFRDIGALKRDAKEPSKGNYFRVIIAEERKEEIVTNRIELLKQITRAIFRDCFGNLWSS